jgi:regulator of sigma E protease
MAGMLDFISNAGITVVSFIAVLGLLVFVHELGHFAVAKWAGIRVEEFGFGYPPRAITLFKKGETEYTLNWLPLGGFVRMVGENGEEAADPRSFSSKSRTVRAAVLVAGSTMNLILPIFLFAAIGMMGVPTGDTTGRVEVLSIEANSPAAAAGLQAGDEILYAGNQRVPDQAFLISLVQQFQGRELVLDVDRNGEMLELTVVPQIYEEESGQVKIGVGIMDQREMVYYNPIEALGFGLERTQYWLATMVGDLAGLLRNVIQGNTEGAAVAGPVGIMQVTGEVARTGLPNLINLAALLSLNLAIMNMLPIPALDGGRLVFVILEAVRGGKKISPEREGLVHLTGMLLLLSLMAFISFFDVQRLFSGGSILQ